MNASANRLRRIKLVLLLLLALLTLIICALAFFFGVMKGELDQPRLIHTDTTCKTGQYRLEIYKYQSGAGYMRLIDLKGKIYAENAFDSGLELTSFAWDKDCKRIRVPSDQGLIFMKVN